MNLLTTRELAVMFGVKPGTIRVWVHRGKFPEPDYRPNSRNALWRKETVDAWKERNRV